MEMLTRKVMIGQLQGEGGMNEGMRMEDGLMARFEDLG